jgi:hypothetical protein
MTTPTATHALQLEVVKEFAEMYKHCLHCCTVQWLLKVVITQSWGHHMSNINFTQR